MSVSSETARSDGAEPARPGPGGGDSGLDFGTLSAPQPEAAERPGKFRIAILGDFTGRANRGELATGPELAARKPIRLDIDNVEDVIARFRTTLRLPVGEGGSAVEIELNELDDLHPDELYENVELFEELASLRRRLKSGAGLDAAIAEMQGWADRFGKAAPAPRRRARGSAVPADRRLSDFQALIGARPERDAGASAADELIQRIVGPHVVAAPDPRQDSMIAAVDAALSTAMRTVLHHPDFQAVEATWRSLDLLARRIETGGGLEIVLYDVSAEEWAADLSAQEELSECGLFDLLAEQPRLDEAQGPLSAVFALYTLEETPPHAELLARMAKIAAHMNAAFVTAISPQFLETAAEDRHALVRRSWQALRELPEARHLGLATPRFLLRLPYGKRTEPVDPFDFEEFTLRDGLKGMLWANPAVLVAILLAETARSGDGAVELGRVMSLDDMPFHYMTDRYGDQVALPCTERLLNTRQAAEVTARGFMPLLSIRGRNVVRLGSFQSVGSGELSGPWSGSAAPVKAAGGRHEIAFGAGTGAAAAPAAGGAEALLAETEETEDALDAGTETEADGDDEDLDALLAEFDDDAPEAGEDDGEGDDEEGEGDDEMDAELAALLEGL